MSFTSAQNTFANSRVRRGPQSSQKHIVSLETVATGSYAGDRLRGSSAVQATDLSPGSAAPILLNPGRTALTINGVDWNSDTSIRSEVSTGFSGSRTRRCQVRFEIHLDRSQAPTALTTEELRVKISPPLPIQRNVAGLLARAHQVEVRDAATGGNLLATMVLTSISAELSAGGDALILCNDVTDLPVIGTMLDTLLASADNVAIIRGELDYETV